MAYTGSDYIFQVALPDGNVATVRDKDINDVMQAKGSILITDSAASNNVAKYAALPAGTSGNVLVMGPQGVPAWGSASAAAGVGDGAIQVKVGNATAVTFAMANQSSATTLTVAAGTTAGYLMIADQAIQVPGTAILQDSAMTSVTNLENKLVDDGFAKTSDIKNGALQIKFGTAAASNLFTANQANAATLTFAEGTTNGAISVNGTTVMVHGLGNAAFADVSSITNGLAKTSDIKDANLNIKLNSGSASKLFSANSASAATLTFGSGSANGSISVNGTDIAVKGLGSAAYENTSAFDAAGAASTAEQNAKDYADGLISGLGNIMTVVGTTASVPTSTTGNEVGDVYIVSSGDHAGEEYVWTGSAWELMGKNNIDLSGYVPTSTKVAGQALTGDISAASISTALGLKGLAFKDSVNVAANTFVTGISATANNQSVVGVGANAASKINSFTGGSAQLQVNDGVLSLAWTTPTLSYAAAATSTLATINVNTYSATKNSAMTLQ